MNSYQIDFLGMSLMNNTPIHLIVGIVMVGLLVFGAFFAKEEQKDKVIKMMLAWFVIAFLTGTYVWTLVEFSIPLLIKSVFATIAFVIMIKIVKEPKNMKLWIALVFFMSIGAFMALRYI